MAAGLATLEVLRESDGWRVLETRGQYLEQMLGEALRESPFPASLARIGSIFWIALMASAPPRTAEAVAAESGEAYATLFHSLLAQGIALAPSAYEVGFLSLAHERTDIDRLGEGLRSALAGTNPREPADD